MSNILAVVVSLVVLGPGALAPAEIGCLERVETRRIANGWGLHAPGDPDALRLAVEDCGLLGYRGLVVVEDVGLFPAYVVDCQQAAHEPLSARGLVADVDRVEVGHRKAVLMLWSADGF